MIPAWSTAAGSIPNSKFIIFHVALSVTGGTGKKEQCLRSGSAQLWNTTQAHTLDGEGKQCRLCEDHAVPPRGTLDPGMRLDKAYK